MREFWSYGPVDEELHFSVPRRELVANCVRQLVGSPEKGGHYFTVWAPRQSGKTWLVEQARQQIEHELGDQFLVATTSVEGMVIYDDQPAEAFLERVPWWIEDTFHIELPEAPVDWESCQRLFSKEHGLFDRPVILAIDEFDKLPRQVIDRLVSMFRDMYLRRRNYHLHGLALIGVRAVLGLDSQRGSPFNIQRSLYVPRFSEEEVAELWRQYREESGQTVEPAVVAETYRVTRGQPGLVGWFGELLTDPQRNATKGQPIDLTVWQDTYRRALYREWNNSVLNLVKKAKGEYEPYVLDLFARSDIHFKLDADWCSYLYTNGIIDVETDVDDKGAKVEMCRFSSPFIQERLYNALSDDLVGDRTPILALEPLDDLADVFEGDALNLPAVLDRYKAYLRRLAANGLDPWREQPRRSDLRLTEAVGHFHLYAWLRDALNSYAVVSPEFPTGNGKVDLLVRCDEAVGIIEVKSYANMRQFDLARAQAARYAASLDLDSVTLALFVPTRDEEVTQKLSGEMTIEGVQVTVVAIGWADG